MALLIVKYSKVLCTFSSKVLSTLTAAVDGELGIFDDGVERLREGVVEGRRADECVDVGESVRVAVYCTLKQSELCLSWSSSGTLFILGFHVTSC